MNNGSVLLKRIDDSMILKDELNRTSGDLQQRLVRLREKLAALKLKVSEVCFFCLMHVFYKKHLCQY